ncbi:MAG: HAD family hydrolase [Promethearchaeota archaeon]
MSDNNLRASQWKDLVGKFFSPQYGGSIQGWKAANEYALTQLLHRYENKMKKNPYVDYRTYWDEELIFWLTDMFKIVNIDPPPYEQRNKIARKAAEWITHRVQAAYPGVIETVQFLKTEGYTLHTASGEVSWELKGYLTGMGIEKCFTNLYGPDLINIAKQSVEFYNQVFNDSEVNPDEGVMVIDDSPKKLSWAAEAGATIVHVTNYQECQSTPCQFHITQLNEITKILEIL